jgi:hypothetical protein
MAVEELPSATVAVVSRRLPEGNVTDKGLDRFQVCLSSLQELSPEDYSQPKAKSKRTWLDDMLELLDPVMNPGAYRTCQDTLLARNVLGLLLGLGQEAPSDALRIAAIEVLIRACFGHDANIAALVREPGLLPALERALARREQWPEQLAALQLAQTVAAGPAPEVAAVAPGLVAAARPFLGGVDDGDFDSPKVLAEGALDCFVSLSFHAPGAVLGALGWQRLAELLPEDAGRHDWLEQSQLAYFVCGLLAANLLGEPDAAGDAATCLAGEVVAFQDVVAAAAAKELVQERLAGGPFAEQLVLALKASAERQEWPQGSRTYHSPSRLAAVVLRLAEQEGYRRRFADAVGPLACAVESSHEPRITALGLRALLAVARDVVSLRQLLALESFRTQTLETLCTAGDELEAKAAVELQSYLISAENVLTGAQEALDNARAHNICRNAPDVTRLAEIFVKLAPLDAEIPAETAFGMLTEVPLAPVAAIRASLSGIPHPRFSFQSWAQHVYGTSTICGWWPGYMEDTGALWSSLGEAPMVPSLAVLCVLFERGARGGSTVDNDALFETVLPAAGLPQDGPVVEEAFRELQGAAPMDLPAFSRWMAEVWKGLAAAQAEEGN